MRFHSWSLRSNHYHLIVEAQQDLTAFIRRFHSVAAIERNRQDATAGRRVWYQRRTSMVFASWFEECADRAFVRTVQTIKIDGINVSDDFDPVWMSCG